VGAPQADRRSCPLLPSLPAAFLDLYNSGMVVPSRITLGSASEKELHALVTEHVAETGSVRGRYILDHWATSLDKFFEIVPNTTKASERSQALIHVPLWTGARNAATAAAQESTALPLFASSAKAAQKA
jgi:hypothetical protein